MSEAPERVTVAVTAISTLIIPGQCMPYGDHDYVRADRYDEAIRQRDELRDMLRSAIPHVEDELADAHGFLSAKSAARVKAMREALAACSPPLAPGDVKTGKVV